MYPRGTFSAPLTRVSTSITRQDSFQKRQLVHYDEHLNPGCAFSRPCVHARVPPSGKGNGSHPHPRRPSGPNDVVCYPQPRCGSHTTRWQGWHYAYGTHLSRCYANPYSSICDTICAIKEDFSSILLDKMAPKYLVLGPGGMGYFAMLGVYTQMYDKLSNVKGISGSSAGALLAFLISIGKTPQEIYDISFDVNIKDLVKYNIKSFLDKYGLIDHSQIREKLISICEREPTFKDLDMDLYIAAFNVNDSKTEYFSKETHPDMSVIDAVCMSISVPFLFSTVKYRDKIYIDGGTMESYPAPPFLNKNPNDVLVVRIITNPVSTEVKGFRSYVDALVRSTLKNRSTYDGMFPMVTLDLSEYNIFDFNLSEEDKLKLFFMYTYNK